MNDHAVDSLLSDQFEIGGEGSAAAGPVGRSASASTDVKLNAQILSYSRSRGLFAGLELKGVVIKPDNEDNQQVYGMNARDILTGPDKIAAGKHTVGVDFNYDGPGIGKSGTATLLVDGKAVADGKIPRTIPFRVSADETLDFGEDTGTPVSEDYTVPFKFTGTLSKIIINLGEARLNAEDQKAMEQAAEQEAQSE